MLATELVFRAMSDATRQRLLRVLSAHDLSVSELVEVIELPQSTVSRHLKMLREAGLVVDRRSGAAVVYAVPPSAESAAGDERGTVGGNGAPGLRKRLLDWIGQAELEPDAMERLQRVIQRRQGGGGFFDTVAARWDQLRIEAFGEVFHLEALTAVLPMDWIVADIGSGTGYLLPALSVRFRKVIAVDPAARMLEVARSRPEVRAVEKVEFREGALGALPLADGEVDLAIVSLVLHHVEQPAATLADLRRSLKPGGVLMIVEQQEHRYGEFHERMGDRWWGFEPAVVAAWLKDAAFEDVRSLPLTTARPHGRGRVDAPSLFVVTGRTAKE
jgi:ubiquinone/menaquinone biosynthesis C-methylase UbiE/DNA-binding transcriptional ArsR family regulator